MNYLLTNKERLLIERILIIIILAGLMSGCAKEPEKLYSTEYREATKFESYSVMIIVEDPLDDLAFLESQIAQYQGEITDTDVNEVDYNDDGLKSIHLMISIKLPEGSFEAAIEDLKLVKGIIVSEDNQLRHRANDYFIKESRLLQLKESEAELMELLERKDLSEKDRALVDNALDDVLADIKEHERKLQKMEDEAAFSYIYLDLMPLEISSFYFLPTAIP